MRIKKIVNSLLLMALVILSGCHFVESFTEEAEKNITLDFDKRKTSLSMGAMDVVNLKASASQNSAKIQWLYDENIIMAKTDNYSAVITGLSSGTTTLTAICGSNSASCVVTVTDTTYAVKVTNPYVYASADYVDVSPSNTVKVSAALFGGTPADNNGFNWSIDKSSVASISAEGNYCWITGVNDGIAKLTVKHNKAAYAYSILVNCSTDGTSSSYITTSDNIITVNLSEDNKASFSVDLMNPSYQEYASGFEFKVVDSLGNDIPSKPVVISNAGNLEVSLTAYEEGECYVRCSHPSALYDLDILVRVIRNAETVFIEPSQTIVTVTDTGFEEVTLSLSNFDGYAEPSDFSWEFSEGADEYIDYNIYNGNSDYTGDRISMKGIKTGSVKITVSYPGVPSRNIIVLVRDIKTEAADALCYITTSQNYVRLSMDDQPYQVNVTLTNSDMKDINDLHWKITNMASDGTNSKVVNYKSGTGKSSSIFSRSVLSSSTNGYSIIEPVNPGTAYIDISHPKALYSTRITVVVTERKEEVNEKTYLNLSSPSVLSLQNGESGSLKVSISGNGNADDIVWEKDGNIVIAGNGLECNVQSPAAGSGGSRSFVKTKLPGSETFVSFTIVCYDTKAELEEFAVKSIYSYTTNARINTEQSYTFYLETDGFTDTPHISWNLKQGKDCVDFYTENGNKNVIVTGKKSGSAVLVASCDGCDNVSFYINVDDIRIIEKSESCYLSTSSNVIYFENINESHDITVDLFNINPSFYGEIQWSVSGGSFDVSANNNTATVTALSTDSSAVLTVSHPLSENVLTIYLKAGSQFEYVNQDSAYISTNEDVFNLFAGQDEVTLVATLNHTEQSDSSSVVKGFAFSVEDESVATISYVNFSNTCYIKPIKNGTTKVIVTHPDSDFEKEVVVIVNNAENATSIPYITTSTNVITVVQGDYVTASVQLMNSETINNALWHWETGDSKIADVIANNGTSALLCANAPGTVEIKVKHDECPYSMKILVVVLDASVVTDKPYISTSSNIITLKKGSSTTLTAEMIGGTSQSDNNYFRFTASNSSMIFVNSSSSAAYIKGLNTGIAYITIYNSRYSQSYSKTVLVVVEDTHVDNVYIKASQSILKLKPETSGLTTVSAELVNGEPTDAENFIWWADDYNLVTLTSVAGQCSITPTGRSGTTKVHIKHEKSAKQADILVMVSDYDSFAFGNTSASINTDKLYFFPLQVPAIEEEFEVKYSSSNENVCIVNGSNSVAWVCGVGYGNASLTASMVAKDGTVIASAELLVSVTVIDPILPVVSLGDTILTVDAGTSRTISATLSGANVDPTERFNLKWSVKNKKKGITILDETPDKTAYGSDVYVTFDIGGEYVLSCEHEASGVSTDLYINVVEKGVVDIELNSNLESVFKDDGSFTLTATLINGTDADYKTIEWSALKVGGQAIVSVSKTKGASCTVTPKNVGQTTVYAKLPNGKTARCIVVVKANTEISLDLGAIHVIPGYTEVVNYRTNPENAAINWYHTMTSSSSEIGAVENYFSYEDDTAKKQLRITGLKACNNGVAGTISATMAGASSATIPSIKVYVTYDVELRLEHLNGSNCTKLENTCPDTDKPVSFNVVFYPTDLDIDIKTPSGTIDCIPSDGNAPLHSTTTDSRVSLGEVKRENFYDEGIEKCRMTVNLVPHAECDFDITVTATLPGSNAGAASESQSLYYSAYYQSYDIEVVDLTSAGAFTSFGHNQYGNVNSLTLGDGEEAAFYFRIKNENASGSIESCTYTDGTTNDLKQSSFWASNRFKTRKEKAKDLYSPLYKDTDELRTIQPKIDNGSISSQIGLIYFYSDDTVSDNIRVYHLSHNWDYYKDLPEDVDGDKWEKYKSTKNYTDDFLSNLDVDYWLVSQEMVFNNVYHVIPHSPAVSMASVSYETGTRKTKHTGDWGRKYSKYRQWIKIYMNGSLVYEKENGGSSYNCDIDLCQKGSVKYKACIPYVMTKSELNNNNALVRPNGYSPLGFRETGGSWLGTGIGSYDGSSDKINLNKLIANGITPTVRKCTKAEGKLVNDSATLHIIYKMASGKHVEPYDIPVKLKRYPCEAYTNGNWKAQTVSGNKRWVLSEDLFDSSVLENPVPYFSLNKSYFDLTTKAIAADSRLLKADFEVYPKDAAITVTVPESESALLFLSDYDTKNVSGGNVVYKIKPDSVTNGIGYGSLRFQNNGAVNTSVQVNVQGTNLSYNNSLTFEITSEDMFVPEITTQRATKLNSSVGKFSAVDTSANMIVLGDGETVTGVVRNADTSSKTKVTNVAFEKLTSSSTPPADGSKDKSGILQADLVTGSASISSGNVSFTLTHRKDYGYFTWKNGTVDEFYSATFPYDESSVTWETAYTTPTKEGESPKVDSAATEQNRRDAILLAKRQVNDSKNSYVSQSSGKAMSSCTVPYYYENGDIVYDENDEFVSKSYQLTPVGKIIVTTDLVLYGEVVKQEILVFVKITENPCASDANYGYAVPQSYWGK